MLTNLLLNTDSYKASHFLQYPPETTHISSYIESRGGLYDRLVFFGLQAFLKAYLLRPIAAADIAEAADVLAAHGLPFHRAGWEHILNQHGGFLPLEIEAIPEGTVLPPRHALVQVINTDPSCFWLTSYLETALLRAIWYPTTVATLSWHIRSIIADALEKTADSSAGLPFMLHDFGARGASSQESAALGAAAHLVNFFGTDTLAGILVARRYYHEPMAGFSIPAAEHSTITSWGRDGEQAAYANMLRQFSGPGKIVAVVSDSYNLWEAIDQLWGDALKDQVIQSGGTLVIRPDSGDPADVVCLAISKLMDRFGYRLNSKGYRVLPPYLRVIQGDGISLTSIRSILFNMELKGLSAENIAFGMGGELLQKVDRDTLRFAMKASAAQVAGVWRDVFKDPATDPGKVSKKGRLAVVWDGSSYETVRRDALHGRSNLLRPVFRNGRLLVDENFQTIRQRAAEATPA
jgi:nicotinamide phosphoribosyltransferase